MRTAGKWFRSRSRLCASEVRTTSPREAADAIVLGDTASEDSLQAKLFHVLDAFRDDSSFDIKSNHRGMTLTLRGDDETPRSVSCTVSSPDDSIEIVAPGGNGFQRLLTYNCQLEGFAINRGGGSLAEVVPAEGKHPLAEALFSVLSAAAKRGDLAVETSNVDPGCCDRPSTLTTVVATLGGKLTCTDVAGGFFFIERFSCAYERTIAPNE